MSKYDGGGADPPPEKESYKEKSLREANKQENKLTEADKGL